MEVAGPLGTPLGRERQAALGRLQQGYCVCVQQACVEPAGLCGRCTGVAVPLRVVSQCTSPKHPVSYIEPGLATRFIHDILHTREA